MNNFLKSLIVTAAGLMLMSCNQDSDGDYYRYGSYMTLDTWSGFYSFTADNGKTCYPGDVSRINPPYSTTDDEGNSKNGNRVFIYYDILPEKKTGYDYNLALYQIVDILSKTVEVAETAEEVAAAGDDRLAIMDNGIWINGNWLDIGFYIMTNNDGETHRFTLLDNKTATPPPSMPEDYQYLEFRHKAESTSNPINGYGYVSFRLDQYAPAVTGKKGLYIRINDLYGSEKFIKVEYNTSEGNSPRIMVNTPHAIKVK